MPRQDDPFGWKPARPAGHEEYGVGPQVRGSLARFKRPTTIPTRIADWEKWRAEFRKAKEDKAGAGAGCPLSIDLTKLHYQPLDTQAKFHASNGKYKGFSGGIGCVAGETKLDGHNISVAGMCRTGIAPVVDTLLGPILASVPFLKGVEALYRVVMRSGRSILVTQNHLFFGHSGWLPLSSLRVADELLLRVADYSFQCCRGQLPQFVPDGCHLHSPQSGACRQHSSSGIYPSAYQPDAPRCCRINTDSMARYSACLQRLLFCDEQPRSAVDTYQVPSPSPIDVHARSRLNWRMDVLAGGLEHSRPYQLSDHPSTPSCSCRHCVGTYTEIGAYVCKPLHDRQSSQSSSRSGAGIYYPPPTAVLDHDCAHMPMLAVQIPFDAPADDQSFDGSCINYTVRWDAVVSIEYARTDEFYDLHVPVANHYFAHGILHHNSGKSKALVYESIYLSAISPNCAGYITAPTHPMLRDAAQTAFFEALQLEGFERGVHYDFKGGEYNIVTFAAGDPNFDSTNGVMTPSQIYFRTASHPDRLRGPNIAWFGMDELTYSDEEAWKIMVGRIRHPNATQHNGYGCWTPKGYDWVWKLFIDGDRTTKVETEAFFATPGENYYLPADFYDSVRGQYDSEMARQEIEGQYLSVNQGQVYYAFEFKENIVQNANFVPGLPLIWCLDFNVKPFCSVISQYVDGPQAGTANGQVLRPWSEIWAIDEVVLHEANTYQMCEEFHRRVTTSPDRGKPSWADRSTNRIVVQLYGDATGARAQTSARESDWAIIRKFFLEHNDIYRLEWNVPTHNPPVRARVNAMNAALQDANGIRRLKISPRCKVLINDLQSVAWKQGNDGTDMDEGKKRELTHISDALGYLIVSLDEFKDRIDYIRKRLMGF